MRLALFALLCSLPLQAGQHFGYPIAAFSYDLHPSQPLEAHAAGDLGIVRPSYARSYLYAAYRWMEGAPMSAEEQAILVRYWHENLEIVEPEESFDDGGWYELRASLDIPAPPPVRGRKVRYGRDYIAYLPCNAGAWVIAAGRLREHIARFGRNSAEIREWVAAQDQVFRACGDGFATDTVPADAPMSVHPDIRRDRLYQTAAVWFNGGRFDEAEKAFRRIEPDPSWPGGIWTPYMLGRTMLWQARVETDDAEYKRLLEKARLQLQNVLRDDRFAPTHDAARFLLLRILIATDPAPGARLLGLRLMSPLRAASRRQDLDQYFQLLDGALQYSSYTKPTVSDPRVLGKQDDLTDWILTFQGSYRDKGEHAVARWRDTGAVAWLLAALAQAPANHPALPGLLAAASKLDRSPGWASVQYYRAQRLMVAGDRAQARTTLNAVIPALQNRPSSANRARALRTQVAASFEESLQFGIQEPASFGLMTSHGEETQPWADRAWYEEYYGPQTMRPMVSPALAAILNASIPLDRFARLAHSAAVPVWLRREMLTAAWARAVTLQRWDLAVTLARVCATEVPETAASMTAFADADAASRPFLAKLTLLRFPGIGVEVRSGVGRGARLPDLQPDGLNWWWWRDGYDIGLGGHPDSAQQDWVTPAERRQSDLEWAQIVALGEGHDWIYSNVIKQCDRAGAPPACAEALYRAGASFAAIGYWHDPAWSDYGPSIDYLVQPILDRRYNGTVWQRQFMADYETLQRRPYSGNRASIPYPR